MLCPALTDVPGLDDEFAVGEVRVVPALLAHLDVLHADRHRGGVPRVAVVRLAPEKHGKNMSIRSFALLFSWELMSFLGSLLTCKFLCLPGWR